MPNDYNARKMLTVTTGFLSLISKAICDAEREEDKISDELKDYFDNKKGESQYKKMLVENKELSDITFRLTKENAVLYTVSNKSLGEDMCGIFRENNVPSALVYSTNTGGDCIIVVPKQFEKTADLCVKSANKYLAKTEVNRDEFYKKHLGEKVEEFCGITPEQLEHIRRLMEDKPVEYCAQLENGEVYRLIVPEQDKRELENAVFVTRCYFSGKEGKNYESRYQSRFEQEKLLLENIESRGKDILIADLASPDRVYRVQGDRLIEFGEKTRVIAACEKGKENEFAAQVFSVTQQCRAAMVKAVSAHFKADKGYNVEDVYTKEEIALAKQRLSMEDRLNGYEQSGEALAAQIVALLISSGDNKSAIAALNSRIRFSEVQTEMNNEEMQRMGTAELFEQYQKLNLSPEEDEAVLQFGRDVIQDYQSIVLSGTAEPSQLGVREVGKFLETVTEVDLFSMEEPEVDVVVPAKSGREQEER